MPLLARSPTSLSGSDQLKVPSLVSMRCQENVQRTVFAPLLASLPASPLSELRERVVETEEAGVRVGRQQQGRPTPPP